MPNCEDYLADGLLHGLRTELGANALDFPKADFLYTTYPEEQRLSLYGRGFGLYGLLDDIPLDRNRVFARAANGEFELIVFADIWRSFGAFTELIPRIPRSTFVAVVDGADREAPYPYAARYWRQRLWWTLPRAHTRALYFKRELTGRTGTWRAYLLCPPALGERIPSVARMRPISFSFPEEKIVEEPPVKAQLLASHVVDEEVAGRIGASTSYVFEDEASYYADLRSARFAVTTRRTGWDCLRHYEIAANGAVPCFRRLGDKPARCAPHGLDETNTVIYRDASELLASIAAIDDTRYAAMQARSMEWARANTTRERAQALLQACGYGGGGVYP